METDKDEFKNTDCLCGNNIEKGWLDKVGGIMVCEDCDIDGINPYDNENGEIFRELCKCYAEKNNLDWYGDREGCINAMLDSLKENEDDN
jgi:hypothetical protein